MKKLTRRGFTAAGILAALDLKGCFDPSNNSPETVYGPPEMFEPSSNELEDVYGPPDEFEPSDEDSEGNRPSSSSFEPGGNVQPDVYGPPPEDS